MKIDPIILEQLIRTQGPALGLGLLGFVAATWHKKGEAHATLFAPSTPTHLPATVQRQTWPAIVLAIAFAALVLIVLDSQKIAAIWPIKAAIDSTWWIGLIAGCLALVWAMPSPTFFVPKPQGFAARLPLGARRFVGATLLFGMTLALLCAISLPIAGAATQWSSLQQIVKPIVGFVIGLVMLSGFFVLASRANVGAVLALSGIAGAAAQMLALDFDALRFALIVGSLATFLLVGAGIIALRSRTRELSKCGIVAFAAGLGVLLTNIFWQTSLFGGATEGDAIIYCVALALAPWLAFALTSSLIKLVPPTSFARRVLHALAPAGAAMCVLVPALVWCVHRSGVLEEPMY